MRNIIIRSTTKFGAYVPIGLRTQRAIKEGKLWVTSTIGVIRTGMVAIIITIIVTTITPTTTTTGMVAIDTIVGGGKR